MDFKNILVALLVFSIFIETTFFSFPFVFIFSILSYILFSSSKRLLFLTFLAAILIDILKASPPGLTAAAIFVSFLMLSLYKKAFEIKDYKVILLILFALSFLYGKLASYTDNLMIYVAVFAGSGVLFSYFHKKKILW